MDENFIVDLYKYLWNTEALYHNRLISVQNDFFRHNTHSLTAFETLYIAEVEYTVFKRISRDIEHILSTY